MTLREKQSLFAKLLARLIDKAFELGYEVTLGECWRSPEEAQRRGFAKSLHPRRLAVDLNLFLDGKYLTDSADHAALGKWWEQQHELCRWGGRFRNPDGNHYSLEHEGIR